MSSFKKLYLMILLCCLAFGVAFIEPVIAQKAQDQLSQARYTDSKGFFKIIPPAGWRLQGYPQDPRGKVAFICPEPSVELRSLAKAVDFDSFEELLDAIKNIEKRLGMDTNIQKITFLGRPAVKRTFIFRNIKLLTIDFIEGNVTYNLQYAAPVNKYDKYLSIVMKSIETYETIPTNFSVQDAKKHTVAQKLRLAQLWFKQGELDLASLYVKEGLEIEPKNSNLLKLKKQIEAMRH